jgi:hypothetical protein
MKQLAVEKELVNRHLQRTHVPLARLICVKMPGTIMQAVKCGSEHHGRVVAPRAVYLCYEAISSGKRIG